MSLKNTEAFADLAGLRTDEKTCLAYGLYKGFHVFAIPKTGRSGYLISFSVQRDGSPVTPEELQLTASSGNILSRYSSGRMFSFTTKAIPMKPSKTRAVAAEELSRTADALAAGGFSDCCQCCGGHKELEPWYMNGTPMLLCQNCGEVLKYESELSMAEASRHREHPVKGIFAAVFLSLFCAVLLCFRSNASAAAIFTGMLLGGLMLRGYRSAAREMRGTGFLVCLALFLFVSIAAVRCIHVYLLYQSLAGSGAAPDFSELLHVSQSTLDAVDKPLPWLTDTVFTAVSGIFAMLFGFFQARKLDDTRSGCTRLA